MYNESPHSYQSSKTVLAQLIPVTLTFELVIQKPIAFFYFPGWTFGKGLRQLGQGVIKILIRNGLGTIDPCVLDLWSSDPKIDRVPLLPRIDVWTKVGRSRIFFSLIVNEKVTGQQTYRRTCAGIDIKDQPNDVHQLIAGRVELCPRLAGPNYRVLNLSIITEKLKLTLNK